MAAAWRDPTTTARRYDIDAFPPGARICSFIHLAIFPGLWQAKPVKEGIHSPCVLILPSRNAKVGLADLDVYQITIPSCSGQSLNSAQSTLTANPVVTSVELDVVASINSQITSNPNDPYYLQGLQWGIMNIMAPQAWSLASAVVGVQGGATIGIIDTGVNAQHEDLLGQVKPGSNWCSAVDTNGNCTSVGTDTNDDIGHGTMVAGIAAAFTNNGLGVASPAYRAYVIPEKVNFPSSTSVSASARAFGIADAVSRGARVINLSLGSLVASHVVNQAILNAIAKGAVVVAAVGNYGNSNLFLPAAYSSVGPVISVAASDQNNQRAVWNFFNVPLQPCVGSEPGSNFGSWVSLYAPGSQIFGLLSSASSGSSAYGYFGGGGIVPPSCAGNGTSFAAPFVAGVASLVLAINPALTPAQVKQLIVDSATKTSNIDPAGNPIGVLNEYSAISAQLPGVIGIWNNENPNTTGITKVELTLNGGFIVAQMWGACTPTACDWGEISVPLSSIADSMLALKWNQGFAIVTQECTILPNGELQVLSHIHFIDNSLRQDFDETDIFNRQN